MVACTAERRFDGRLDRLRRSRHRSIRQAEARAKQYEGYDEGSDPMMHGWAIVMRAQYRSPCNDAGLPGWPGRLAADPLVRAAYLMQTPTLD